MMMSSAKVFHLPPHLSLGIALKVSRMSHSSWPASRLTLVPSAALSAASARVPWLPSEAPLTVSLVPLVCLELPSSPQAAPEELQPGASGVLIHQKGRQNLPAWVQVVIDGLGA